MDIYKTLWKLLYETMNIKLEWDGREIQAVMRKLESDGIKENLTDD